LKFFIYWVLAIRHILYLILFSNFNLIFNLIKFSFFFYFLEIGLHFIFFIINLFSKNKDSIFESTSDWSKKRFLLDSIHPDFLLSQIENRFFCGEQLSRKKLLLKALNYDNYYKHSATLECHESRYSRN